MDPRLLHFYSQELQHVRDMGAEFARKFPKVASRLSMDSTEVDDPYVERLLEGFAFLTARVQLKLQEELPEFSQHLIQALYPNFISPLPAMGMVQFNPLLADGNLKKGVQVRAGEMIASQVVKGVSTPCKFRVCHNLTLWPLEIVGLNHSASVHLLPVNGAVQSRVKSALYLKLQATAEARFCSLPIDTLDLYVSAADEHAFELFERLAHDTVGVYWRSGPKSDWQHAHGVSIAPTGLEDSQAMLPVEHLGFGGFRLLQEFFAMPHRFLNLRLNGLQRVLKQLDSSEIEFAFGFKDAHAKLDQQVGQDSLSLFCTPVVNLFAHRCDRILLDVSNHEYQVQADRAHPDDFEIFSVSAVTAFGQGAQKIADIAPLYQHGTGADHSMAYSIRRQPTLESQSRRAQGGRSRYIGSDAFIGFSIPSRAMLETHGIRQVCVSALCTNRDLPLLMPLDQTESDFQWVGNLPLKSIRMKRGPSRPRSPVLPGRSSWHLIELLSMNYLALVDNPGGQRAQAITQLLTLFADPSDSAHRLIAQSVKSVGNSDVVRRVHQQGAGQARMAFAKGLQVRVEVDEFEMQGLSLGVLGAVLAEFFARYVTLNSFVETELLGLQSGKRLLWPARSGTRAVL